MSEVRIARPSGRAAAAAKTFYRTIRLIRRPMGIGRGREQSPAAHPDRGLPPLSQQTVIRAADNDGLRAGQRTERLWRVSQSPVKSWTPDPCV